jgi:hypothetical protein
MVIKKKKTSMPLTAITQLLIITFSNNEEEDVGRGPGGGAQG